MLIGAEARCERGGRGCGYWAVSRWDDRESGDRSEPVFCIANCKEKERLKTRKEKKEKKKARSGNRSRHRWVTQAVTRCHSELQKLQKRKQDFQQREGNKIHERETAKLAQVLLGLLSVWYATHMPVTNPPRHPHGVGHILLITEFHSILKCCVVVCPTGNDGKLLHPQQ